jgi:uncharacterized protein (TIGR02117 family)
MARYARIALAGLLALLPLYGMAGLVGGAIPTNAGWREASEGVRIYVEDNGVHTGIVMPVRGGGLDLSDLARPGDLRDVRYGAHGWRAFGWGDRDFYLGTPTWADVNPLTVLRAAIGSHSTVMHVEFVGQPHAGGAVRSVMLSVDEYRRLAGFVRASFAGRGGSVRGYDAYDAFYPARGGYSAVRTCNAWTGEALRAAGVRMGAWTPFPGTVMAWLPRR